RNGFELSVCQNRYITKEEARAIDESYCDRFNPMALYYENDPAKIFLPLDANNRIESSNQAKIRNINASIIDIKNKGFTATVLGRLYYNSRFKWKIPGELPVQITQTIAIPNETPFDRSYVQYTISSTTNTAAVSPDCNRVFRSLAETEKLASPLIVCKLDLSGQRFRALPQKIFQFKNLQELDVRKTSLTEREVAQLRAAFPKANILYDLQPDYQQNAPVQTNTGVTTPERLLYRINLDEKGYPDKEAQSALRQVVDYLNANTNAKVRLVYYYADNAAMKQNMEWIGYMQNYLRTLKFNPRQFDFETKRIQQQQQKQAPQTKGTADLLYYADVFGINFSENFLRGQSRY
ncbi:MAG: hypothetical protein ICV66_12660, partial [Chitinophagaceae bacterium]|nr:hypothetical protein [Chitinophagaceae bacterium]